MDDHEVPQVTAPAPVPPEQPQRRLGARRLAELLGRLSRVQRIVVVASAIELVVVALLVLPALPGPLRAIQTAVTDVFRLDGAAGDARVDAGGAQAVAVGLLWGLLLIGAVLLWLAVSWRLFRFPSRFLLAAIAGAVVVLVALSATPVRTLVAWIAIAVLARAYLRLWQRGRVGFTRGASAAVFAQLSQLCALVALPFALVSVVGLRPATPEEVLYRCARWLADSAPLSPAERAAAMPPECRSPDAGGAGAPSAAGEALPSHDVDIDHGRHRIEVVTLAASPAELRALFDSQLRQTLPGPAYEVHIRCAAVPDEAGVDAELATGWFARTQQGAEAFGLASVDDVEFRLTGRGCGPLPLPPAALDVREVITAAGRAGLAISGSRDVTATCHRVGCLRRTEADQVTVTVWPTPQRARDDVEGIGGYGAVLFGPQTTVRVTGLHDFSCADPDPDACAQATIERLESAAEVVAGPSATSAAPPVAGAQLVGGGGRLHPNVAPALRLQGAGLTDLDLSEATAVAADAGGGVWLLVQGEPGSGRRLRVHGHRSTALRVRDATVDAVHELAPGGQSWLLGAGPNADVAIAVQREGGDVTVLGKPTGADDRTVPGLSDDIPRLGLLAMAPDGTLLAAHRSRTRIDAVTPDGTVRHLVGVRNFDPGVEVRLDSSLGEVTSLVALPGGRVALTADDHDAVVLLDDGAMRDVTPTPADPDRTVVLAGMAPDGRLLAVAAGPDTHPRILAIDTETGAADTVADLEGVLPHPEGPRGVPGALWAVAATADGDDLLFLADGHLWRLPDAFAGTGA